MGELSTTGVGVATADPELKTVGEKGTSLCTVTLAFNRSYQDKNKKWQSEPCFLKVQMWGPRADKMMESVKKGQPVYVSGYMKQDLWEKDGQKRVSYSINVRDFQPCVKNGKKKSEKPAETTAPTAPVAPPAESNDDDDMPF